MAQEGAAELFFHGRREQKAAFPPWAQRRGGPPAAPIPPPHGSCIQTTPGALRISTHMPLEYRRTSNTSQPNDTSVTHKHPPYIDAHRQRCLSALSFVRAQRGAQRPHEGGVRMSDPGPGPCAYPGGASPLTTSRTTPGSSTMARTVLGSGADDTADGPYSAEKPSSGQPQPPCDRRHAERGAPALFRSPTEALLFRVPCCCDAFHIQPAFHGTDDVMSGCCQDSSCC